MKSTKFQLTAATLALAAILPMAAQAQVVLPNLTCFKPVNVNQACQTRYQELIVVIEGLRDNGAFLSRNYPNKDADGLIGKVSGADCKMQQTKVGEALAILQDVDVKAHALVTATKPKLTPAGFSAIQAANSYAIACTQQQ